MVSVRDVAFLDPMRDRHRWEVTKDYPVPIAALAISIISITVTVTIAIR